jgi:acyl-CoA thioester hydrolase
MGVVYHANYLVWLEVGRVELVRAHGVPYKKLEETEGLFLGVIEAKCRYLYPARYDQEILIDTSVTKSTTRAIEFSYELRSAQDGRLLVEATTRHLWLNREMRPARLPQRYAALLHG